MAPLCAKARVTGTVIKKRLKRVADFVILISNRDQEDVGFKCMVMLDMGLNARIAI